ncbi:MAG TPA: Hsp70 family protein, partial [Kofleriaceae bacterium]|nr:Hsp70 family protein [Kofleriaceae bacterium]
PAVPGAFDSLFEPPVPRARRVSTVGIDLPLPIDRAAPPTAPTLFDQPLTPGMFDAPGMGRATTPPPVAPEPPPPMPPAAPPPPPAQPPPIPVFRSAQPAPASASTPTLIGGLSAQSVTVAPPPAAMPVVLDVTPRSLGIGTVAGFCEELIRRNARVPTETRRMFTTSRDQQQTVRIRVCTGESRRIDDNVVLGDLVLEGLPARPRGQTRIEVTFALDASGILNVRARDAQTGQEQRATLDVLGAQSQAEVDAARARIAQLRR